MAFYTPIPSYFLISLISAASALMLYLRFYVHGTVGRIDGCILPMAERTRKAWGDEGHGESEMQLFFVRPLPD